MENDCVGGAAATRPGSSPPIIRAHGKRSFRDFGLIGFITLTPGGSRCVAWLAGRPGGPAPASSKATCPRLAYESELVMCKGLAAGNPARISARPHGHTYRCHARRNLENGAPPCPIPAHKPPSKTA